MLQALAGQCGPARRGADEEAAGELVGHRPDRVAGALEAEHRVEDVERDHVLAVGRVRRPGRGRRGHRPGLGDALVEHLAVLGLFVGEQQLAVDRLVLLTARVVDLRAREHRVHPEGAVLVRSDRHDPLADLRVLHPVAQESDDRHRGGHRLGARALLERRVDLVAGQDERLGALHPLRHRSTQLPAAFEHVLDLGSVLAGVEERRRAGLLVGAFQVADRDRQVQPVAELLQVVLGELLHLVGGVLALQGVDRPALDRLGEDHGGLPDVLGGGVEGGIDLAVVVPAAGELLDLRVAHVLDHRPQARVGAEEVVADVGAVLGGVRLEGAVGGVVHPIDQDAVDVAGEQGVPALAPHDLDDVPAGSAEVGLELLDDLAVAGDRPVELLQVAVDDPGEVVELLARGDPDGTERLRLRHLAVAHEGPDVLVGGVLDVAVVQVAVEPGLVDRVEGGQPHRDGGELPEVRHQPGVGVRRQARATAVLDLLAEAVELLLVQAALEEGTGVDARGAVALDVDLVAAAGAVLRRRVLATEEVVEADLVEAGRGLVGRDVAADFQPLAVGAGDHHRGVPPDERANALLDLVVAGEPGLALGRDRVDVVGAPQGGHADLHLAGALEESQHDVPGAFAPAFVDERVEGVKPVGCLVRVDIRKLGRQALVDDGGARAGTSA